MLCFTATLYNFEHILCMAFLSFVNHVYAECFITFFIHPCAQVFVNNFGIPVFTGFWVG